MFLLPIMALMFLIHRSDASDEKTRLQKRVAELESVIREVGVRFLAVRPFN